mmetsp:Transcript_34842/g.103883  ORF Transcript_34842/g.103883 Transcript_34842/m.103883 type:complete len:523 (-) Transcript_34842:15-1583(-)
MPADVAKAGLHDSLPDGRVRVNDPRNRAQPHPSLHGEGHLVDDVARAGGDDGRADDGVGVLGAVDLDDAASGRLPLEDDAVVVLERRGVRVDRHAGRLGVASRQPDGGDLGLGVAAARHHERGDLPAVAEERVLHGQLGHLARHVREARYARRAVADRVHARVGRGSEVVNRDALLAAVRHARRVEAEPVDVRRAARRNQQRLALQLRRDAAAAAQHELEQREGARVVWLLPQRLHLLDVHARHEGDAVGLERLDDRLSRRRLLLGQDRRASEHRHLRAKGGEGLRHLHPDDARAEHDHPRRERSQVVERRVGDVRGGGEAGRGRHRGAASRRDDALLEAERALVDHHRVGPGEPCPALVHVRARRRRALVRVGGRDVGAQPAHPRHHGVKIDLQLGRGTVSGDQEPLGQRRPCLPRSPRAVEQRLGRDAADVEAVAAREVARDERRARTAPRRLLGRHQPARARADCDDVVLSGRFRLSRALPGTRTDGVEQLDVALVERPHVERAGLLRRGVRPRGRHAQ